MAKNKVETHGDKQIYKGYIGKVTYDGDANILFGEVINTKAVITFKGDCIEDLKSSFKDSVDAYLEFCEELDEEPESPPKKEYSGKLTVRLESDLHRAAAERAYLYGHSLNSFIVDAIEKQLITS
jgi:predicted HicB family RNase H-like nuclease